MVFRNFDRKLFAKAETTAGTAATITTNADFVETIAPSFTITPLQLERQPKTQVFTPAPMTVAGLGKGTNQPAAIVEFTFGVELCGPGGTPSVASNLPEFDDLLLACGLERVDVHKLTTNATSYDGTFFNREAVDFISSGGSFSSATGESFGDNAYDDGDFLLTQESASGNPGAGDDTIIGQRSGKTVTLDPTGTGQTAAAIGVGYRPKTSKSDDTDTSPSSACTIRLYLDREGTYIQAKGCRGTFDIAFVHGDRAVINFTFQGVMDLYTEGGGTDVTDYNYTMEVPPAWISTNLDIGLAGAAAVAANYSDALFNALTFTLGNEMAVRENTNSRAGYKSAIITGRSSQLTFNPDMTIVSGSVFDYWNTFLAGSQARMRWTCGSSAGNKVEFRCPAAQFTGITDGERDTVSILDSTTMLTGGDYGSSLIADAGTQTSSTLGADNEFQIIFR